MGRRRSSFSLRASLKPFGIGEQRPNNFGEVTRAIWENRDQAGYAWRILNEGVCDGCALGTKGMRDWTLDGVHLCNIRLRLLRMNTMPAFDPSLLADVEGLRGRSSAELRGLGRLPRPMVRRAGDPGFSPIGWDEALDLAAERIRSGGPDRLGAYLTSRGTANETYYAAQKAVRAMGSNSIDNAARVCHSPSTFGLKEAIGVGATTCSYTDWLKSDLIVFIGSNVANNQPVTTKYLHHAKREGARVAVLNPYREPGMERYWIPSVPTSAVFGTRIADDFFSLNVGGDLAFLTGALRHLVEQGWVDRGFVEASTTGFPELEARLGERTWEELEASAGATREQMLDFARLIGESERGVLVWSMGVTQHEHGEDNVRAIVNLGLARGWIGREGCGLMPIRGHSGVQGGAEMGCYATALPGGLPVDSEHAGPLAGEWGFEVPAAPGRTAPEMIDAAHAGELDVLISIGGNFLEVLPDPAHVREALGSVPLRVHYDIVLSSQMLVDPAETALLLPATTRYEIPGGVTETSTERRVILSPEVQGPRVEEARPEWEVLLELARRVRPDRAEALTYPGGTAQLREEIARVVPLYSGIERLSEGGDSFQYGGERYPSGPDFPTPDGKAHFSAVSPPPPEPPDGLFAVATRRGKQFNSMVQERKDSITGAGRDSVMVSAQDAERLGVADGDSVTLRSAHGEMRGRALIAPVAPGSLQVHWPEANSLLARDARSEEAGIPDFNTRAELIPLVNYGDWQNDVYLKGLAGEAPAFPVEWGELEAQAAAKVEPGPQGYVWGGAGSGDTMRANLEAFRQWRLVPRHLRDTAERDLSVEVLGARLSAPVMLAPIGVQQILHPDGELASARGAAAAGIGLVASTAASNPLEAVAEAHGENPRWFQLYWPKDPEMMRSMVARAEASGYGAIVVTLDNVHLGYRPADMASGFLPFIRGVGIQQYTSDPVFRARLDHPPEDDPGAAIGEFLGVVNEVITWDDLPDLRAATDLPILLKGVLDPDDAKRAREAGVNGVVVSNHGGRQVDGAIAALDALPDVAGEVGGELAVLFDSGIRGGADAAKALALGAEAVLLGRPYLWGLLLGGADGVEHVLRMLLAELDLTMALVGARTPAELTPELLRHAAR